MKLIISFLSLLVFLSACSTTTPKQKVVNNPHKKRSVNVARVTSFNSTAALQRISHVFSQYGWKVIGSNQAQAYRYSGTKSKYLQGFESPRGSQVYMVQSNGSESKPRNADYLDSIMDMSVTDKLFQLSKGVKVEILSHSNGTRVLHHTMVGNGNGKTLYIRAGIPTRFSNAYLPVQYPNGRYGTLVISFRGRASEMEEYNQFKKYIDTVKLSSGVRPLL